MSHGVVNLETLATEMHCSVDEVRARIVRALQAAGIIPAKVEHVSDGEITRRIIVAPQVDERGRYTWWVQDTATGDWRQL